MVAGTLNVGIVGASGFTGAELLRLCAQHPNLEVVLATGDTQAGVRAAELYPSLAGAYRNLVFTPYDPAACEGLDLVFLGLPHGAAQGIVPDLRKRVAALVDLSADFRLKDPSLYPTWYGEEHQQPTLLEEFVFGLPELFRDQIEGASLVAAPGCYVTAASLALAPLLRLGLIDSTGIVVDAASGVSGAGRPAKATTSFELTAGGTVLVERYSNPALPGGGHMVTAYHLDGAALILTHYCIAKNQPTLRADRFDAKAGEIQFEFLRGTNMASEDTGHMRRALYRLADANHFTTSWEFFKDGNKTMTETETFTRIVK